jgi:two-component system sensor histidine kinase KdpD
VRLVPLRFGTGAIGVLAAAGRPVEAAPLDALAGVVAIAIERATFLEERETAAVARQSEELKSALLASLSHDLKTPLAAIRVSASNLKGRWLGDADRQEQSEVILAEVERLSRLFQNILEMARIDAGAVSADVRWVHPAEIIQAARDQVGQALRHHQVHVHTDSDDLVRVDPRLTSLALAHVLENAAQYTPAGSRITITVSVSDEKLTVRVRDYGPGIAPVDLPHLFDRFYRGAEARQRVSGTGMGLPIALGLLAAESGSLWAENCADGGAQFTTVIPADRKRTAELDQM